ncbi:protein EFR3 [Geosmithia morbida]|uniref:Protein EFR3 n=1 Tax=Geosmithia morbida TaxID=1094350 RepID=A0A9P4YZB8_9HYPO|nr:protein EFR3 [Geosmithia morbida]KAF4124539.1 protein EFR3 [Geosmithia morbida]
MNAIQQKCRPKHQVLVLKCYPRASKTAVDVKPNSSELSYLLFYATSRRSKIVKVGAFLEKKTASDVWRMRIGNVQVTLGILAALLEKSHKDATLIAPCVLKILDLILHSKDITMIESSLLTFEAFCRHHDSSPLFGEREYSRQYEAIVRSYAALASTSANPPTTGAPVSRPMHVRWRSVGLKAIRSVASSEALATVTGRQIDVIIPAIVENIWNENIDDAGRQHWIESVLHHMESDDKADLEKQQSRRRQSAATAGTVDEGDESRLADLSSTANDLDKHAEEEIGVLAAHCLKNIFEVPNRSQIQGATASLLKFVLEKVHMGKSVLDLGEPGTHDSGWAITLLNTVAKWAPVQDRFVILVVALETLIRCPVSDEGMGKQMVLVAMVGALLRSKVNLIGLSVMDILLGLVRQLKKVLFPAANSQPTGAAAMSEKRPGSDDSLPPLSPASLEFLRRLEQCLGDLATHVYYADQITDMIEAIIARITPSHSSSMTSTPLGGQGEKAEANDDSTPAPGTSAQNLGGEKRTSIDAYFSHTRGRACGLRVIKAILLVANPETKISGNLKISRNRVPLEVWEGTQWLLRDPEGAVRKAYVDAISTWLDRETTPGDMKAKDDGSSRSRATGGGAEHAGGRRVVSATSNRDRIVRNARTSQFLPLLHISVYDNALQFVDYEADIALLHALLARLVLRLGVNAARYGIPMMYQLQEDIQEVEEPANKVRIAAMCHGYFWVLSEKFDFESSVVGRAILNEVSRRRSKGFWVEGIEVPPPPVQTLSLPGQTTASSQTWDLETLEREELLPFDDRISLVECIATHYSEMSLSPPGSPSLAPSRTASGPTLGASMGGDHGQSHQQDLPTSYREDMLTEWSRDETAATLASAAKAESLNGSRSITAGTNRNRLTISTAAGVNGNGQGLMVPYGSPRNFRPTSARVPGERDRFASPSSRGQGKSSIRSGITPSDSGVTGAAIASVDQLKMILSGSLSTQSLAMNAGASDDSDDSVVSYDYSPSEASFNPPRRPHTMDQQPQPYVPTDGDADPVSPTTTTTTTAGAPGPTPQRSASMSRQGPLSSNPPHRRTPTWDNDNDELGNGGAPPPVPVLPSGVAGADTSAAHDFAHAAPSGKVPQRRVSSRGRSSVSSRHGGDAPSILMGTEQSGHVRSMDLQDLLRGLDSHSGEGSLGNVTKPPY